MNEYNLEISGRANVMSASGATTYITHLFVLVFSAVGNCASANCTLVVLATVI